jgi:hypothetical protein
MEKDKDSFLTALQHGILRHNFDTFVDNPPSVAQGGRGCVVPGCVPCKRRFQTTSEFLEHLAMMSSQRSWTDSEEGRDRCPARK